MRLLQKFVCQSETCRREMEVEILQGDPAEVNARRTCDCGAKMKKAYSTPVLFRIYKASQPSDSPAPPTTNPEEAHGTHEENTAPTEIAGYAIFAILGLYMLYMATTGQNLTVPLAGTLCFVLGLMALIVGVRNAIWHRQMLRQSPLHQNSEEK